MEFMEELCSHFGLHLDEENRIKAFSLAVGLVSTLVAIGILCLYTFPVAHP